MAAEALNSESLTDRVGRMVISASGWRGIFGDGDESLAANIDPASWQITILAATAYADRLVSESRRERDVRVLVGRDTRPTGAALLDAIVRALLARGVTPVSLDVVASPEIMAYCKTSDRYAGFFYATASHNPTGHNGFKFGFADGAVAPGPRARPVIESFRALVAWAGTDATRSSVEAILDAAHAIPGGDVERILADRTHRSAAHEAYRLMALSVASGAGRIDPSAAESFAHELSNRIRRRPVAVVAELNGSARTTSIDRTLLPELGVRLALYNDEPGHIVHQILPEGEGLAPASALLGQHSHDDPDFVLAYVPDNDGDRGNLVFQTPEGPRQLEAQEVFALVTLSELIWLQQRAPEAQVAIVCNGPTSLRIERIAAQFNAAVTRVEVGEANVVAGAAMLRERGFVVPVLGEGSNGGSIVPPATVRDPLSTLLSIIRLLAGRDESTDAGAAITEVIDSLPRFMTLETDDPRAKVDIGPLSHAELKAKYEALLPSRIEPVLAACRDQGWGDCRWSIVNYEGTETRAGTGNRTGAETGGLRVVVTGADGTDRASLWMRGSGTEPVFRVLVDCEGDNRDLFEIMVATQRAIIDEIVESPAGGS